jgi:hydrogenase maturation protein HypF
LGYGTDGTLWGGEFLIADLQGFERVGHLATVPMPGGTAAIKEPWRMAAVYLEKAWGQHSPPLAVTHRHAEQWRLILQIARIRRHAPLTSSVGRLFDAVAALLGIRDTVSYEGQAAIELEQLADPTETALFSATCTRMNNGFEINGADLIRAVVEGLLNGMPPVTIAARFHNGVAEAILHGCQITRENSRLNTVALSGGVFQNMLLLERTVDRLETQGFRVLRHRHVPPNDGGISLGQAVIAGRTTFRV